MKPFGYLLPLLLLGCGTGTATTDAAVDLAVLPDLAGPCDDATQPCPAGQRCFQKACIPDNGTCAADRECENDTYCACAPGADGGPCMNGVCLSWGSGPRGASNPACQGVGFLPSEFAAPVEKCHWTPSKMGIDANVIMTPLVVDLDLDGKPEIVFSNYADANSGLVAIRGSDCSIVFEKPGLKLREYSQLAAADLDGDKYPEIIAVNRDIKLVVFDRKGEELAVSPAPYPITFQGGECSGPAIADVDGDGTPEIVISGQVHRYKKGVGLDVVWSKPPTSGSLTATWGTMSVFADLDGDNKPEVLTGLKVYDGRTGDDRTPKSFAALKTTGAYPQVADFNGDKKPDILLVQSQEGKQSVVVIDYKADKVIFGPFTVEGGGWGGPATIADFDGDGVPDFGVAGPDHYYAYALKCAPGKVPKPADCTGKDPGVLWSRLTAALESGGGSSSAFDFNGDGKIEVVYRDSCWLRVLAGADGKTLASLPTTSTNCLEVPVVADVDGDGHAELIVVSDNRKVANYCAQVPEGQSGGNFAAPSWQGLRVLRDPGSRWAGARPLWNQHAYHVTNVNDDQTIPPVELASWTANNSYRHIPPSVAKVPSARPDLSTAPAPAPDNGGKPCAESQRLWGRVCNRGAAPASPNLPSAFYATDPNGGKAKALCVASTTKALAPGDCEVVHCDWPAPPGGIADLYLRAADDGTTYPLASQCTQDNDLAFLPGVVCKS